MTVPSSEDEEDGLDAAKRALAESERRYQTLFETMAQGVVYQDKNGRIISANPAAERMLGMTLEVMQGRTATDPRWRAVREDGSPFPDDERPSVRALRTGKPALGVITGFYHPELNETRWLRNDSTPELDPVDGSPVRVYSILEDITDRLKAEKAAAEASRTVVTILENVTDAFFALDKEFRYTYVNRRGEEITHKTREELLGRRVWDVYPDLIGSVFYHQYYRAMAGDGPVTFEEFYAGSQTWYRAHAYATPDGLAVYLRNITAERRAAEERAATEQRQREFMRDVLASVTNGKLHLCFSDADLPGPCPDCTGVTLTPTEGLRALRLTADEAAGAQGFSDDRRHDLVTAVSEAGMNAIVHAGGGVACVRTLPDHIVQVWIVDEGAGISVENLPRATLEKGYTTAGTLGHGMKMMLRSTDRVYLLTSPTGTTVVLEQGPNSQSPLLQNEW
ncbi:hypothetical protein CCAX7_55690 [Capsulimonas corticalis]|uniref:Uncharacterized protein n=1 Tax=Capsulimonas corticalis TaxID=2219043 RepID=A0A402D0S1_9BACT|nr:PAS domain S-box protein [Capsulimonas corticalis]BDI33518.1 hypothetical protein CCAX7_55690 [Capsulimonas corticalis]